MTPAEGDRPEISDALKAYSDRVFAKVPLREKHKHLLRYEFETHLEDHAEELQELGYKPYAADDEIVRRVGPPDQVAENFNRVESLRNWLRDPACIKAVFTVAGYFIAFVLVTKLMSLMVGLSGHGQLAMSNFDLWMGHLRVAASALSGLLAYFIYAASTQNPQRVTPFATLSVILFFFATGTYCGLHLINAFPSAKWDIFFRFNVPYFVFDENPWRFATFWFIRDFDIYTIWAYVKPPEFSPMTTMDPHGPYLALIELVFIFISTCFVIERVKYRDSELAF